MTKVLSVICFFWSLGAVSAPLPPAPTDSSHPGSLNYTFSLREETFTVNGRKINVFLPQNATNSTVIIYGHGQATPLSGYLETFRHLAKKGVAVVFPEYDSGFFDQEWVRMAQDYLALTRATLSKYSVELDKSKVVFSGHSKGAYIALMAAGLTSFKDYVRPGSLVLFAPAGYNEDLLKTIDVDVPVTIAHGDSDSIVSESMNKEIYEKLSSKHKQFVNVKSYAMTNPQLKADHFFVLSDSFFFGGKKGISPFHYYGAWKWLLGAAWDLSEGATVSNTYAYGKEAESTGIEGSQHFIIRNW